MAFLGLDTVCRILRSFGALHYSRDVYAEDPGAKGEETAEGDWR